MAIDDYRNIDTIQEFINTKLDGYDDILDISLYEVNDIKERLLNLVKHDFAKESRLSSFEDNLREPGSKFTPLMDIKYRNDIIRFKEDHLIADTELTDPKLKEVHQYLVSSLMTNVFIKFLKIIGDDETKDTIHDDVSSLLGSVQTQYGEILNVPIQTINTLSTIDIVELESIFNEDILKEVSKAALSEVIMEYMKQSGMDEKDIDENDILAVFEFLYTDDFMKEILNILNINLFNNFDISKEFKKNMCLYVNTVMAYFIIVKEQGKLDKYRLNADGSIPGLEGTTITNEVPHIVESMQNPTGTFWDDFNDTPSGNAIDGVNMDSTFWADTDNILQQSEEDFYNSSNILFKDLDDKLLKGKIACLDFLGHQGMFDIYTEELTRTYTKMKETFNRVYIHSSLYDKTKVTLNIDKMINIIDELCKQTSDNVLSFKAVISYLNLNDKEFVRKYPIYLGSNGVIKIYEKINGLYKENGDVQFKDIIKFLYSLLSYIRNLAFLGGLNLDTIKERTIACHFAKGYPEVVNTFKDNQPTKPQNDDVEKLCSEIAGGKKPNAKPTTNAPLNEHTGKSVKEEMYAVIPVIKRFIMGHDDIINRELTLLYNQRDNYTDVTTIQKLVVFTIHRLLINNIDSNLDFTKLFTLIKKDNLYRELELDTLLDKVVPENSSVKAINFDAFRDFLYTIFDFIHKDMQSTTNI